MKNLVRTTLLMLTMAIPLVMISCKATKPIDKSQLAGYWVLKSMEGKAASEHFEGSMPSIEFDFDKGMIAGSAGCNRYFGGFTLTEQGEFIASKTGSTMMACLHKNAEPQFLKLLNSPTLTLSLNKEGLLTFADANKELLVFQKGEMPEAPKAEPAISEEAIIGEWILTSFTGEDVAKLFGERKPTINFASGGMVSGNGGCNNYRSTYKFEANVLSFTSTPVATLKACPNMAGEDKFVKALHSPHKVSVAGEKLTLLKDENVVMEFKKVVK